MRKKDAVYYFILLILILFAVLGLSKLGIEHDKDLIMTSESKGSVMRVRE